MGWRSPLYSQVLGQKTEITTAEMQVRCSTSLVFPWLSKPTAQQNINILLFFYTGVVFPELITKVMGLCINPDCEKAKKQEDQGLSLFCTGCGSSLLINDLYRVIKFLDGGGFGVTYLVDDCGTPKVLKILHHTDPKAIALFDQEALVLQNLNHPGMPTVEAGGRFDYFPRGSQEPLRCLVMEYIEGETLEDYVAKNNYRPISEQAAVRWLRELMEILAQVHSANYFHRDIKPANVMLRSSGQIALIDFGTAREETQTYLQKLQGKGVTGIVSVGYTPHEQVNGKAEYRSDFFTVGRTFVVVCHSNNSPLIEKGVVEFKENQERE